MISGSGHWMPPSCLQKGQSEGTGKGVGETGQQQQAGQGTDIQHGSHSPGAESLLAMTKYG